jgi:Ca-activated chloride channel family protein
LAEALGLARRVTPNDPERPSRILIVSDGVVEDRGACLREVEKAADEGTLVSTIGVGDEFDEELLMRIADDARGSYAYAPAAPDVEAALNAEVEALARLAARRVAITIRPDARVVFRELFQVAPTVSRFNTLWMEGGGYRYCLGDLARGETIRLLAEFVLPPSTAGRVPIGQIALRSEGESVQLSLEIAAAEDPWLIWERDGEVVGAMEAIAVYLAERRAQQAAARSDYEEATRQLRHTTRILQRMGRSTLAADFEAAAGDLEAGRTISLSRTKQLKAATRRLDVSGVASPSAAPPAPRDLVHRRGG